MAGRVPWLAVLAEAFPLGVAAVGAALWTLNLDAILLDRTVDEVFVLIVFPPLFLASGIGWVIVNRVFVGIVVFAIRAVTVLVMMYYLIQIVLAPGGSSPEPDQPVTAFFFALALSLAFATVSVAGLLGTAARRSEKHEQGG